MIDLDPLAEKLLGEALDSEEKEFRLDAFKALSAWDIGMKRIAAKKADEEEETGGFSILDAKARIAQTGQSGADQVKDASNGPDTAATHRHRRTSAR